MHHLIKPIFWTILFLALLLGVDQLLVQVPSVHPAHTAVSNFYRDFRGRLIDLAFGEKQAAPKSIEAVIDRQTEKPKVPAQATAKRPAADSPPTKPAVKTGQRYIYSDAGGELQFADSLEEVPVEFRGQAQPMAD